MKLRKGTFGQFPAAMCRGQSPYMQVVFAWLCFHANESGECFPSLRLLAEEAGMDRSTVVRAMKKLVEIGYVIRTGRKKEGKKEKDTSVYEVIIMEVGANSTEGVGADRADVGANSTEGVGANSTSEPNPSSEPNPITKNPKVFSENSQPLKLAEQLFDAIRLRHPGAMPSVQSARDKDEHLQAWAEDFDLMLRKDRRDFAEAQELLDWSQKSGFWKKNILSAATFRKQYDTLYMQAEDDLAASTFQPTEEQGRMIRDIRSYANRCGIANPDKRALEIVRKNDISIVRRAWSKAQNSNTPGWIDFVAKLNDCAEAAAKHPTHA